MFYSQFILAKKGPLGTIWIAAHLERKLRKNQVADTDIGVSVDSILSPDVPIALRLSSHLLLGVVRIYSKKVNYLFDDCSDALLKVKQAFRSAAVDLPPEESTAPYHSITLPETFDLDDFELPDAADIFRGNYVDHHVSSKEQITLQDTMDGVVFSTSQFGLDERFGDGDTSGLDLEELDKLGQDADTSGYAQAPSTPGLAEEPNLSTAQEPSMYDDHHDLDEEEPNSSDMHMDLTSANNQDSLDHEATKLLPTEEKLTKGTSDVDIYSDKDNEMNGFCPNPAAVSDLPSPAFTPLLEEPLQATSAALTLLGDNDGIEDIGQLEPKTVDVDQSSVDPQDLNGVEGVKNSETPFHLSDVVPSDDPQILTSDGHEKVEAGFMHVLQPCNHLNELSATVPEPDLPELCSNVAVQRNDEASPGPSLEIQEPASLENNQTFGKSNDQDENVMSMEPPSLDISNSKEVPELPEQETLLSAPASHVDEQIHLFESTPNNEHSVVGDIDNTGTSMICGKKRTFTESTLTMDSINSVESLGVVQSKRTKESVPDDNDLLSSILVGRKYSVLKLKPTPPPRPQTTSKKRPRSTTRLSSSKRRVTVDETMVLHGDQIRLQLTHTEDIRRVRKKAPCTRAEIWMIRKEHLEEEIFTEPIFTGSSSDLASMYSQSYDLSDIKLSRSEAHKEIPETVQNEIPVLVDTNLAIETEKEVNDEPLPVRSDIVMQLPEREEDKTPPESLPHGHSGETSEMHINEHIHSTDDALNTSTVNGVESDLFVDPVPADKVHDVPTDSLDLPNDSQLNGLNAFHDQILETHLVEMDAPRLNASDELTVEVEAGFSVATSVDMLTANDSNTVDINQIFDEGVAELSKNELGDVNVSANGFVDVNVSDNAEFSIDDARIHGSGTEHAEAFTDDVEIFNINNEHSGCGTNNFTSEIDPENAFVDNTSTIDYDSEYNINGHDTGFLNDDDDDFPEEGEDCIPSAEHTGINDNTGWSSRTRAVAKYLQVLFDKEATQGRTALPMNNLLVGKTRKEASRMFFEALVLKTRDYIHVEQDVPFGNINMKPRAKLMKAEL